MADIVINPAVGKIDFFAVKGDNVTNTLKLTGNTLLVTGPLSASSISTGGGGAFVTSVQPTANYLSKFTGNSTIANSLIYDNATNVGIGTSSPLSRLHVSSTTSGTTLLRADGTSGTLFSVVDDLTDSLMSVNNSAGLPVLEVFADDRIIGGQYGANDFVVRNNKVGIGTNILTAKLQVTSSASSPSAAFLGGNVGIGTTSPIYTLDIPTTAALTRIGSTLIGSWQVGNSLSVFGNSALDQTNAANYALLQSNQGITYLNAASGQSIRLRIANTDKVIVDSNGNLGIGTTSAGLPLTVYNATAGDGVSGVRIDRSDTGKEANLQFSTAGAVKWWFQLDNNSTDNFYLFDAANAQYRMTWLQNGNIGIGTTSPSNKLHVSTGTPTSVTTPLSTTAILIDSTGDQYLEFRTSGASSGYMQGSVFTDNGRNAFIGYKEYTGAVAGTYGEAIHLVYYDYSASDSNNGLYIGSSATPASGVSNVHVFVKGNGSVGIGTTSPIAKLDVNGTSNFAANVYHSIGGQKFFAGSGGTYAYIYTGTTALNFINGNDTSTLMTLLNGGSVGIGTSSPGAPLTIYKASNPWMRINGGGAFSYIQMDDGTSYGYLFKNTTSDTSNGALAGAMYTYTDSGKAFQHIHAGTPLFTILSGGNVGIGTTAPSANLQVGTNSSAVVNDNSVIARIGGSSAAGRVYNLTLANTATATVNNDSSLSFIVAGNYSATGVISALLRNTSTAATDLVFTNYNNALFERMRIQFDGNVGIGSTAPAYKLDVNGTFNASGTSTLAAVSITGTINSNVTEAIRINNNNGFISFYNSAGSTRTGYLQGNTGSDMLLASENSAVIRFAVGGSEVARISTNGNVGIGTTSPSAKLQVDVSSTTGIRVNGTGGYANILSQGGHLEFYKDSTPTYAAAVGLSTPATALSNDIQFATYNGSSWSARMTIANGGNVGIGTTSPSTKLHVVGNADIGDSGTDTGIIIRHGAGSAQYGRLRFYDSNGTNINTIHSFPTAWQGGTLLNSSAGAMNLTGTNGVTFGSWNSVDVAFASNGSNYFKGSVGIGTTSPSNKLHVSSGDTSFALFGPNTSWSAYLAVGSGTSQIGTKRAHVISTDGNLHLDSGTSNQTYINYYSQTATYINSQGGQVTIGSTNADSGCVFTVNASNASRMCITDGTTRAHFWPTSGAFYMSTETNSPMIFITNAGERMRIAANGNVGIGSSSPAAKLDIVGTNSTIALSFGNTVPNNPLFINTYGSNTGIGMDQATAGLRLAGDYSGGTNPLVDVGYYSGGTVAHANWVTRLKVLNNGNVGIGTTSPSWLLTAYATSVTQFTLQNATRSFVLTNNALDNLLSFNYASINRLQFDLTNQWFNTGNLGIGTTSPISRLNAYASGSNLSVLKVDGGNGTLFEVTDQLSGSLFSVNTISGVPALEVFSNNTIVAGKYGSNVLVITGSSVGIGTSAPATKLDTYGPISLRGTNVLSTGTDVFGGLSYDIYGNIRVLRSTSAQGDGMYIGYAGSGGPLRFFSNSGTTEWMTVAASGFVGISTTSPGDRFQVNLGSGENILANMTSNAVSSANKVSFRLLELGSVSGEFSLVRDGTSYQVKLQTLNNQPLSFGTNATTRMVLDTNGNLGIGSTAPAALLNIRASTPSGTTTAIAGTNLQIDSNASSYISFINTADNGTYAGLVFTDNNNGGYIVFRNYTGDVNTGSDSLIYGTYQDHIFQTGTTAGVNSRNEVMRIKNSGYVGINTNNPTGRLHIVQGNSGGVAAILLSTDESTIQGPSANTQIRMGSNLVLNASNVMPFNVNASETMRIINNGNIGIGTTTPLGKLHVYGLLRVGGAANEQTGLIALGNDAHPTGTYADNGIFRGGIGSLGSANYTNIGSYQGIVFNVQNAALGSQATRMIIDVNGNVGIGTTGPTTKLQVNSTTAGATLLRADGTSGTLFSVVDDLTDSLMSVNNSAGLPVLEVFADDRIVAGQYGANDFVVRNNKVGIGTNNPIGKLHVTGSTSTPAAVLLGDVGIGTTAPTAQTNYRFLQVNGTNSAIIETMVGGTRIGGFDSGASALYVGTIGSFPIVFRTAVVEKMRLDTNGNLGIGTSSPTAKVDTLGVRIGRDFSLANRATVRLDSNGTSFPSDVLFGHTAAANQDSWNGVYWSLSSRAATDGNKFYFYRGSGNPSNASEAVIMTFEPGLNVGIGSTSPTQKLDVAGSIYTSAKLVQKSATQSLSGTTGCTIDLANGVVHILSLANATTISSFTYNSRDNNPSVNTLMLVFKYAGTASVTFTNVIWANGVAPTLTGTNGYADVFMLTSYQGGAATPVWIGTVVAQALVSTNL